MLTDYIIRLDDDEDEDEDDRTDRERLEDYLSYELAEALEGLAVDVCLLASHFLTWLPEDTAREAIIDYIIDNDLECDILEALR